MKKMLVAIGMMSATCAFGNVFDDCVYWFCGGRDSNGDGLLQTDELPDTMHANDAAHDAHKYTIYGWSRVSGMEALGVQLREEDVFCPAQGVTNRTLCLFLPQSQERVDNGNGTVTTNYCNNSVLLNTQLLSLAPGNEYTCILRVRRERQIGNEWFFNCYNSSSGGFLLGFTAAGDFTSYGYNSSLSVSSPGKLPTNCWADVAVVVSNQTVRLGLWRDKQLPSASRGSGTRYTFTSTSVKTSKYDLDLTMQKMLLGTQDAHTRRTAKTTNTGKMFCGSYQQIAFWNRALSDEEVLEAWQTPMADVWRLGLANDSTAEMGGTASDTTTVDVDAITADGRWQDVPGSLPAGGTLNLDFTFRKTRFGAASSAANVVKLCVNGVEKIAYTNDAGLAVRQLPSSWENYEIHFEPGELKAGDNLFWWNQYTANRDGSTPCTYIDFHRFEVEPKPNGTMLILR